MPQSGYVSTPTFQFQNQSGGPCASFGGSSDATPHSPTSLTQNSAFSYDLNQEVEDGKQDRVQWKLEEDKLLISMWLNVSKDPQISTDQKGETFWKRICQYCQENQPGLIKRSMKAIPKRWARISQTDNRFGAFYDQATRTIGIGSNNENVLRKEPKWRSQSECGGSKRTKVTASGVYYSSNNKEAESETADEVDIGSTPRLEGIKSSTRKGKGKSNATQIGVEHMEALNLAHSKKLDMMSQIKEVLERDAASREIMAAAKKKDMEIKERSQMMEILYKDTSNLSQSQLDLHTRLLDEVKAKYFK